MALDLTTAAAREIVHELVRQSDVVIENFRSGPSQAVNPQRRTASDLTEITPDFYSSKV
jgi:hypothetical protein